MLERAELGPEEDNVVVAAPVAPVLLFLELPEEELPGLVLSNLARLFLTLATPAVSLSFSTDPTPTACCALDSLCSLSLCSLCSLDSLDLSRESRPIPSPDSWWTL